MLLDASWRKADKDEEHHEQNQHPTLTKVSQYQEEAEECEDDSSDEDIHVLRAGRNVSRCEIERQGKANLLRSIQLITSLLIPNVFAASKSLFLVPFSTFL